MRAACHTLNGNSPERRQRLPESHAIQAADLDPLDGKILGGNQLRFHAALHSHKAHLMSARTQFARDSQGRKHMASGAAAGHHEMFAAISPLIFTHAQQHSERCQRAQQRTAAEADHGQRKTFCRRDVRPPRSC